ELRARKVTQQGVVDAELVVGGDALGDRDHQLDSDGGRFEDRVGGETGRHEDHRGVRLHLRGGLLPAVEDGYALDVLAALSRRHPADDVRPVATVVERVEAALAARDAGHAEAGALVDQDRHQAGAPTARPEASATTFSAASFMVAAGYTLGSAASRSSLRPCSSLVPSSRTTNGIDLPRSSSAPKAAISPSATSSQRVIPPKMLKSTALTASLARISSTAPRIFSALDPPPASRKLAGRPPAWATTSSVDMTSPAPLPRIPMSPSSLTYCTPSSLARRSSGSSLAVSERSWFSGWR